MHSKTPIVIITWIDAETTHGWQDNSDTDTSHTEVLTIGFLISEDEKSVVVASSVSDTSNNSRMKIPRGMILSMTEIAAPKKTVRKKPVVIEVDLE